MERKVVLLYQNHAFAGVQSADEYCKIFGEPEEGLAKSL